MNMAMNININDYQLEININPLYILNPVIYSGSFNNYYNNDKLLKNTIISFSPTKLSPLAFYSSLFFLISSKESSAKFTSKLCATARG